MRRQGARMYRSKLDPKLGIAVLSWQSAPADEAEWQRHIDDVISVRGWKHLSSRPCVIVELLDSSFLPDARQRRDIVNATDHSDFRPQLSVVSTNPMIRGVLRALTWLKATQDYPMVAFRTAAEAIAWHEKLRGHPVPELGNLVQQVHRDLGLGGRGRQDSSVGSSVGFSPNDDVAPTRRLP